MFNTKNLIQNYSYRFVLLAPICKIKLDKHFFNNDLRYFIFFNLQYFQKDTVVSLRNTFCWISRSSRPEVFCKKGVLRNFAKFTGKYLCQSLLIKKKTLAQMFSCEFCEISKNSFFTEHLRWLLLDQKKLFSALQTQAELKVRE